jgi:phosphonate transport system permease protein
VSLPQRETRWDRRGWLTVIAALVIWSVVQAGADPRELINTRGWSQVKAFFSAMVQPDLSASMIELTITEAAVTVGYALVGTALALVIGTFGGVLLTERVWRPMHGEMRWGRVGWLISRLSFVLPRSMHEVVFGIIAVNILGLDPLVAVLAIGIPFGEEAAKVFAELIDEVSPKAEQQLRAQGVGRLTALLVATLPQAFSDLLSYAFYRFECSLRSAAVLGIVGAGGIGFQLALSFQSLRYDEMWTLLWALIIMSGIADRWSSAVRRRRNAAAVEMHVDTDAPARDTESSAPERDRFVRYSAIACALAVPIAMWRLDLQVQNLWSDRSRLLARELVEDAWPPQLGVGGLAELVFDSLDTIALAVLSTAIAWTLSSPISFLARRPRRSTAGVAGLVGPAKRIGVGAVRFFLLICRSVPPPVWAFVVVFVLFPGLWPGAVALAIYNFGVLGRLQSEVLENSDPLPAEILAASGATQAGALTMATVPTVASRFAGLGLYRWEVAIRETVIVGVVGAAGLGRRLDEQTSSFDYDGILATIMALLVVTAIVDVASAGFRRTLR